MFNGMLFFLLKMIETIRLLADSYVFCSRVKKLINIQISMSPSCFQWSSIIHNNNILQQVLSALLSFFHPSPSLS